MVQAIGTWVYAIAATLIVVAFVELLLPRSATAGLVRVVAGLCIIAIILEAVLSLLSAGFAVDLGLEASSDSELAQVYRSRNEGESLAAGTLAAIAAASGAIDAPAAAATVASNNQVEAGLVSATVAPISVPTVPLVKVGVVLD